MEGRSDVVWHIERLSGRASRAHMIEGRSERRGSKGDRGGDRSEGAESAPVRDGGWEARLLGDLEAELGEGGFDRL